MHHQPAPLYDPEVTPSSTLERVPCPEIPTHKQCDTCFGLGWILVLVKINKSEETTII